MLVAMDKCYSELVKLKTLIERYEYLRTFSKIGEETFGGSRYLNQYLYTKSDLWKSVRRKVILRDNGRDLGLDDYIIQGRIIVHHINPLTKEQLLNLDPCIFDMENLISCSHNTHNAIHYGDKSLLPQDPIERRPFDTCPWR
jgi:hypothetical protein